MASGATGFPPLAARMEGLTTLAVRAASLKQKGRKRENEAGGGVSPGPAKYEPCQTDMPQEKDT